VLRLDRSLPAALGCVLTHAPNASRSPLEKKHECPFSIELKVSNGHCMLGSGSNFQHRNCLGSRFVPDAVIAEKLQGVPSNSGRISVKNLGQHTETEGLGHVPVSTFRRGIAQVASKAEDMVFSMRYQTFAFCDEFVKQKSGSTASITSHSKTTGRVSFNPPFIMF
jgi:hypothetical protein